MAMLCIVCTLLLSHQANSQVIAGIRANGQIVLHGDTIRVCRGSTITYQSVAQGTLNIFWKFNSGSMDKAEGLGPFTVRYDKDGYDSTFQRVATGMYADSMFVIVHVSSSKPRANFTFAPDNVCGNEFIKFRNTSSGGAGLSSIWSFNDGNESVETNPSHQFLSAIGLPGTQTFDVRLITINDNTCTDTITRTVTIKKVPDASIGNGDNTVLFAPFNGINTFKKCSNIPFYNFKFTNQSSTITNNVSYRIQWGDGMPDSTFSTWDKETVINHTFPRGSYTMTVNAFGPDGCIGIKKYNVFIGTTPAGGLASLGNTDICSSDSLRFAITNTADNPPGTSYTFYINDGAAVQKFQHAPPSIVAHYFKNGSCSFNSNNGLQTYSNAFGAYLTIENPCGSNSASVVPIYVSGKPRPSIYVPAKVVCAGTSLPVTNVSSFGNVVTPTGTFSSTCENKGIRVWAISPATGYILKSGNLGSLNGKPLNGAMWTDGSNKLNVQFTKAGMYQLKIYIYNERCGLDSTTETICVRLPPTASFDMSAKRSCGPATVDMTNTSPFGGCEGEEYKWDVVYDDPTNCAPAAGKTWSLTNESTVNTKSPSFRFEKVGRYIVTLTVHTKFSYGCTDAIAKDTFYISGVPKVKLDPVSSVCIDNSITPKATADGCYSVGTLGFQWSFENGSPAMVNELNPGKIFYNQVGKHPLQLIVTDSSCMLSDTIKTLVSIVPLPHAFAGNDTAVCSGAAIHLGMEPVTGVTYRWTPAQGLSDAKISNPVAKLSYTGNANDTTYKFYLSASLGAGCTNFDSVEIKVKRSPVVSILPAAAQVCAGTGIALTASGADVYSWKPADGLNISDKAIVFASPVSTTDYLVTGTLANGCFADEKITVKVIPDAKADFTASQFSSCAPLNISRFITVNKFPEGNGTYNWYADDVLIGTNTNGDVPDFAITDAGKSVQIKLVTISAAGCKSDTIEHVFETLASVTAQYKLDKKGGCGPLAVNFNNVSSDLTDVQFMWDFGNGQTSTDIQPGTVVYNASPFFRDTMYFVVLKATVGCDTSYYRDTVTVSANVKARFGVDTTRGCSPFVLTMSNNSQGNATNYYWDFGDGHTDTTHQTGKLTHTFYTGEITTYTIRLIAENTCERDTQYINIVVSPNQIQPFISGYGNQLKGCAPHRVTFSNSTIGASQQVWDFGDSSAPVVISNDQPAISHLYSAAGVYNISIRLINDCSDTTIYRKVEVFAGPVAAFTAVPLEVCEGQAITVANQSSNANAYEWTWGDGATSAFVGGQHSYTQAGSYDIRLVAQRVHTAGFVCSDTLSKQIKVVKQVPAQIFVAPGKACVPYTLKVQAENAANAAKLEWTIYDSSSITQKEFHIEGNAASHVYNVGGSYSVSLVVHTTSGCTDTAIYKFDVHNTPRTTFEQEPIATCVHDTTLQFNAAATHTGNDVIQYKWFVNNNIEGTNNPFNFRFRSAIDNQTDEEFIIKALAQNSAGCGDTSTMSRVVIHPLPVPAISVGPSVVIQQPDNEFTFKDLAPASPDKQYTWSMGDRSLQTRTGQQVTYQYGDTGTYNVKLLVKNLVTGCMAEDSVRVTILHIPGYLQVPNAMCLGCNVMNLRSFLPLGKGLKTYRLTIYTTWGQKIFETTSLNADGSPNMPWDGTANGKPLQQDAYTWQIEATFRNGTEWKGMLYPGSNRPVKAGFITIIK
jgi:PKD repeat protein